jgi:hypothetical protein
MSIRKIYRSASTWGIAFALAMGATESANAATGTKDLKAMKQQVELLKQQLQTMELKVDAALKESAEANQKVKEVQGSVSQANASAMNANATALNAMAIPESSDLKFRFAGSVEANYGLSRHASPNSSFGGGTFLPIFLVRYKDVAELEAHMEVVNDGSETKTSLEYAQIDLFLNDYSTLVTGKFLSPIGQFQQSLHPGWINKLPDRPAGFVEGGGGEALSDVGLMLRGAFPVGQMTADYAFFVGNGPQLQPDGLSLAGYSHDNNNNKSVGGRLGLHPVPDLNLGISAMHSQVPTNAIDLSPGSPGSSASHNLYDVDFSYTPPNVDIRGEYVHAQLKPVFFDDQSGAPADLTQSTIWKLWYLQGAYRLSGMTSDPTLGKFEIVARRSQSSISGGITDWRFSNEKRWEIGLNYWWTPTLVGKIAYAYKAYQYLPNDNLLRLQMAFGF